MAYLRSEKDTLEIVRPINKVWTAIPEVTKKLNWTIEESDENTHHVKIKTKGAFFAYPSTLTVNLSVVNDKTCRLVAVAETPVTTLTSVVDFGRTRERLEGFIEALAQYLALAEGKRKRSKKRL